VLRDDPFDGGFRVGQLFVSSVPTERKSTPVKRLLFSNGGSMQFKVSPSGLATRIEAHTKRCAPYRIFALLLLGFTFITPISRGQNKNTGEIRGTVVDRTGAVISGATVDALNIDTGIHVHGVTGAAGEYDIPLLEAGQYSVTIGKPGFKMTLQSGITLHVETITVDATLQVGAASAEVSISAGRPDLLETETSSVNTLLPTEEISELPNVSRSWETYMALLPGAYPAIWSGGAMPVLGQANTGYGQNVGMGGAPGSETSWLVDGGVATLPVSYNIDSLTAPLGAIEEISVDTSTSGAEMGNGMSSANIITKSGTNAFHGQVSEFDQNSFFNAQLRNWSSTPQQKTHTIWNEYEMALGGPIIRNRLFFFFDYQSNPQTSATAQLLTFPTDDMRGGDFSGILANGQASGVNYTIYDPSTTTTVNGVTTRSPFLGNKITSPLDPVALQIQKYFPEPNAINPSDPYNNNYYFAPGNPQTQQWYDFKIDGNLSARDHLYVSGLTTTVSAANPAPACAIQCAPDNVTEFSNQISDTYTFSPTKLNEFRASIAREGGYWTPDTLNKGWAKSIGLPNLPVDNFPSMNISQGLSTALGAGLDAKIVETSVAVTDTFDWVLGKHTIKIGGEYDNWTDNQGYAVNTAGSFDFNGIDTRDPSGATGASDGVGYADFLLGGVQSWSDTLQLEYGGKNHNVQAYAQDYYKVRSNLTLNFGGRFIDQAGWTEEHNRWDTYVPTLLNPATNTPGAVGYGGVQVPANLQATKFFFSPRVGFAYSPKPFWAVHAGFGLYATPWGGNAYFGQQVGVGSGFEPSGSLEANPNNLTPVFQLQNGNPPLIYPTAANRTPDLFNGQGVEEVNHNTPISFAEEWNVGVQHQMGHYVASVTYAGNKGIDSVFNTDVNSIPESQLGSGIRPQQNFQSINEARYIGWSNYNSLQITGKREFAAGSSFTANYTWAHLLDTGTTFGASGAGISEYQNAYDVNENYGNSGNDIRHSLNVQGLYQLPFGRGRKYANSNELEDATIGGWQLSGIYQFHTGVPYNYYVNANYDGQLSGYLQPNLVPGKSGKVPNPSVKEWFDTTAYVSPPPNTFGDAGRNSATGPHFWDTDLSVAKTWAIPRLGEKTSFQFKADSYDVFNHPNYGQPQAGLGNEGYGTISSSLINRVMQFGGIIRF
jgi:hypothetical protein